MKNLFYSFFILLFFSNTSYAYIDPASGSAIMSVIIGATVLIGVFLKTFWYKLKSLAGFKENRETSSKETKNNKNI
tara:strand:- start:6346 stop:6573 length:228 start_codon:yes stop_codon:yes gene_type:complete